MLIYGAGGHAKVIISCILANNFLVNAVFDDNPAQREISDLTVFGVYDPTIFSDDELVISIGDNFIRREISTTVKHRFGTISHPSAIIDKSVKVGHGTVVLQNAVIQADSVVGNHVIINTSASIDHDCFLSDFVHIAPGVVLAGNVKVGENTLVGTGSIITPGLVIGKNCLIAAGSVVTKDIPDEVVVRGNPARIIYCKS